MPPGGPRPLFAGLFSLNAGTSCIPLASHPDRPAAGIAHTRAGGVPLASSR